MQSTRSDHPRLTGRHQAVVNELCALADRHQWDAKVLWTRRHDRPTDAVEVQLGPPGPQPLEHATVAWSSVRRTSSVTVRPGWCIDLESADAYIAEYRTRRARNRHGYVGYDGLEGAFFAVTGHLP